MSENLHAHRALAWLASAGGTAGPGELGAALGLDHDTQARVIRGLRQSGLADGNKRTVALTPAGWARSARGTALPAGEAIDAATRGWESAGAYAHAAGLRLLCSSVVARYHLAGTRPRGHLGFMAIGETGTGKTSPVEMAAHLFGLDGTAVKKLLYTETPGSLLGRREPDGKDWRLVPSEAAGLPLLLLDEFDKADKPAQTMGWAFFQGETTAQHEGQAWPVRPVPVLNANPPEKGDRYRVLRPEYRRRSVVLDTGYMRGRGGEIEDMLHGYYRGAVPGALRLDDLKPPADRLDDDGLAVLRLVREALTEAGRAEFPGIDALELAALGRLALAGSTDHRAAAYATGLDYLHATETMPGMVDGDRPLDLDAVRQWLGEDAARPLAAAVETARKGRVQAVRHARSRVAEREKIADDLTHDRDALAERLRLAAAKIEPRKLGVLSDDRKAHAVGIRGVLGKLRRETQDCRSAARLSELADRAAGPLADAGRIAAEVADELDRRDRARQEAAQQQQAARRHAAESRRIMKARQKAVTAGRNHELGQVTAKAKEIEQLYRRTSTKEGEKPLAVLRHLGLLTYVPRPPAPQPQGWRARVRHTLGGDEPLGDWHVEGAAVSFPGWPAYCPELARWGAGTRAALAPALDYLHAWEDKLRYQLGKPPRKGRPQVTAAPLESGRTPLAITSG